MFQLKVVEKIKIYIFSSETLSRISCRLWDNVENVIEPERPQMTIWRGVAGWISKATHAQAHVRSHAPTPTHTRARACTHTHTEMFNTYCFSMAEMVSWTRLNVSCAYIAYLVLLFCVTCDVRNRAKDGFLLYVFKSSLIITQESSVCE